MSAIKKLIQYKLILTIGCEKWHLIRTNGDISSLVTVSSN